MGAKKVLVVIFACAVGAVLVGGAAWFVAGRLRALARPTSAGVLVTAYDAADKPIATECGFFASPRRLVIHRHMFRGAERIAIEGPDGQEFNITQVLGEDLNLDTILLMTDVAASDDLILKFARTKPVLNERLTVLVPRPSGIEDGPAGEVTVSDIPDNTWVTEDFFYVTGPVAKEATGGPVLNAAREIVGFGTFLVADGRPIQYVISSKVVEKLAVAADRGTPRNYKDWLGKNSKAVKLHPLGRAGRLAGWAGRDQDMAACYLEWTKADPENPAAWTELANAYAALKRPEDSAKAAAQAVKADPKYSRANFSLGWALDNTGKLDEAVEAYKAQIRLNPTDAGACCNLGLVYLKLNRNEEAVAASRDTVRVNSNWAEARVDLGLALSRLGKTQEAIDEIDKAIAVDPKCTLAYSNLADIYLRAGRPEDAIKECRRAIAADPKCAEAYVGMGVACMKLGRTEEALAQFLKATDIQPTYVIAQRNVACAYGELKRFDKSAEAARKAIAIDPKFVNAWVDLAYALRMTRQYDESVAASMRAIELDPKKSVAHEGLGYTYVAMGKKDLATEQYNIMKDMDPPEASYLLKAIEKME